MAGTVEERVAILEGEIAKVKAQVRALTDLLAVAGAMLAGAHEDAPGRSSDAR